MKTFNTSFNASLVGYDLNTEAGVKSFLEAQKRTNEANKALWDSLDDLSREFCQPVIPVESIPAGENVLVDHLYNALIDLLELPNTPFKDFTMVLTDAGKILCKVKKQKAAGRFDASPLGKGLRAYNDGENITRYNGLGFGYEKVKISFTNDDGAIEDHTAQYWIYEGESTKKVRR